MWWHHEGFGWFALFGGLLWLILWGTIIYLIVSLVSSGRDHRPHDDRGPREEDPLDIAKRRYAKGEITKEEFDQIRKDLTG